MLSPSRYSGIEKPVDLAMLCGVALAAFKSHPGRLPAPCMAHAYLPAHMISLLITRTVVLYSHYRFFLLTAS